MTSHWALSEVTLTHPFRWQLCFYQIGSTCCLLRRWSFLRRFGPECGKQQGYFLSTTALTDATHTLLWCWLTHVSFLLIVVTWCRDKGTEFAIGDCFDDSPTVPEKFFDSLMGPQCVYSTTVNVYGHWLICPKPYEECSSGRSRAGLAQILKHFLLLGLEHLVCLIASFWVFSIGCSREQMAEDCPIYYLIKEYHELLLTLHLLSWWLLHHQMAVRGRVP